MDILIKQYMAEANNTTLIDNPSARKPLTFVIAVLALVLVGAFSVYLNLQKSSVNSENERLSAEIVSLNNEINVFEGQKIEAARIAQKYLAAIEKDEVKWSQALTRIRSLIPYDASSRKNKVDFASYSGTQGGKLSMNASTLATREDPYIYVAEVIRSFNASSFFSEAYVPSITRGETDDGEKVATFLFNVNYKDSLDIELTESLESTSPAVKISR
jgi:Tfp pilus assembly protein PilN